eukprot:CAMPEP_0172327990 /NCGR_PEP_ID=MMETSP1058-20130122/60117_1 /TAXON_ID=83371 /ORGANISM="Detonula confervacea, Strain CCMP 353" /LENGTH=905 /DNA_ID=CAMNT_0013045083 /DNA_START=218 /DNA_END=2935 /DNA_ORIENTATION=-
MNLFGQSKSSPTKVNPPEATSASQEEEEKKRSGNILTSRFGMGKQQRDVQEEGELECASYSAPAMKDTKDEKNTQPKKNQQEEKLSTPTTNCEEISPIIEGNASKTAVFKHMVSSVLPKVEPLPWTTFFCISIWCTIPAAGYILLFTQMGFGESLYYTLSLKFGGYSYMFSRILVISGFFFYILDIGEWNSAVGNIFRFICTTAMFSVFVIIVMLTSNEHPFGLISLFALFNPLWLLLVKSLFYRKRDARTYVSWLSGPLLLVSLLTAVAFIVWICLDYDNEWNSVTRAEAAIRTGCEPNFEDYPNCVNEDGSGGTCFYVDYSSDRQELVYPENCDRMCLNVYNKCSNGFILWTGPVLICLSMLFLSFFCTFLRTDTGEEDIFNFGKLWFFVLFIMWASVSLSGAGAGITSSLLTLTLASLIGAGIFLSASFSKAEQEHNKEALFARINEKYGDNLDVVRGLFVVTCSPLVIAYFFLSAINQLVRRIGINPCAQKTCEINASEKNTGIVTMRAKKQLTKMRSWDRAKVLTYAVYWGVAYMILQVLVANLTVVFLSWMIEKTANLGLVTVTGIMCGVGVMMFLLPPVPGVPVYLTLGIVLTAKGHEILGWTGSILYSTGVGLVLKIFSSALQQKMIGENLSHYVKVRQFVGINSTLMKAMQLVLGKDGLSVPKVSILIGGPDWPTSVLCGIMRLSLPQIVLGTIPVVFLIFPTCLTGALLYMTSLETDTGNPEFPWAGTVSTITASSTALVQFGSMIVAAYYLEQASDKRADEVAAIKDDKEVKEADEKDEHMRKCYETVTQWNAMPLWSKLILTCSLVCITSSCYMVQFFSSVCFAEHSLTDSIDENLGGNVGNLFLPLGWASVILFGAAIILLSTFSSWGKHQAEKLAASEKRVPLNGNPSHNV